MYIKTKTLKKIIAFTAIVTQVALSLAFPYTASADLFDIGSLSSASGSLGSGSFGSGSMTSVIRDVENRYHLNKSSMADYGEFMNASNNKEMVPQVNLFFNPSDPKPGKEVTAQAFPLYFSNQKDQLYFTWYLKREKCDLHSKGQGSLNDAQKLCDLNNDDAITVEDWKIAAMRRIANGGFAGGQGIYDNGGEDKDKDGYDALWGGDKSTNEYCYVHDFKSGEDYELKRYNKEKSAKQGSPVWVKGCRHLFTDFSSSTSISNIQNEGDYKLEAGNGSFIAAEEEDWHTDPEDPSTAQNGNKDEANAVGLGRDTFTWNYAQGDKVGVAIEGISMNPTKHGDSSMKVMWALAKNECDLSDKKIGAVINKGGSAASSTMPPVSKGSPYGDNGEGKSTGNAIIPTASINMNKCLEKNLVDPTEGDQAGRLEVKLVASKENPIIDSYSKEFPDSQGDLLSIQSSLINSTSKETNVSYDWQVFANRKQSATADNDWESITGEVNVDGLLGAHALSDVSGNDLSALKINLNILDTTKVNGKDFFETYFADSIGYFRINLTATENFDAQHKRVGRASIVIKIIRAKAQIQTHAVEVAENGKLKIVKDSKLCEEGLADRAVCPVVKGQIIGVSFDTSSIKKQVNTESVDSSWTINNQALKCTPGVSDSASCKYGAENFFPVTGEIGEVYTVTVNANNTLSGKSISLTRRFQIVDPSLIITSNNSETVWPKYLGQYVDADGKTVDNFSTDIFETLSGETFGLQGMLYPNSLKDNAHVTWSLNGVEQAPDAKGILYVNTTQSNNTVHTVSLRGIYVPSPAIKKAMVDIWGISTGDVTETTLSRTIQVEVTENTGLSAMGPLNSSKKFFASIISYVPTSVIFFFRLAVTIALILVTIGIVFSFVPEKRPSE